MHKNVDYLIFIQQFFEYLNKFAGCIPVLIPALLLALSAGETGTIQPVSTSVRGPYQSGSAMDFRDEIQLSEFIARFDTCTESAGPGRSGMAVVIVNDGRIIFAKGYGTKTAGGSDPAHHLSIGKNPPACFYGRISLFPVTGFPYDPGV